MHVLITRSLTSKLFMYYATYRMFYSTWKHLWFVRDNSECCCSFGPTKYITPTSRNAEFAFTVDIFIRILWLYPIYDVFKLRTKFMRLQIPNIDVFKKILLNSRQTTWLISIFEYVVYSLSSSVIGCVNTFLRASFFVDAIRILCEDGENMRRMYTIVSRKYIFGLQTSPTIEFFCKFNYMTRVKHNIIN